MRFLQINTYYPAYLRDFYAARPHLLTADYNTQIEALLDDGFSESHIFSRSLRNHGFETFQIAINNPVSQNAWLRENGLPMKADHEHAQTTLLQIEAFAPDIMYTTDVLSLSSALLRGLKTKPPVVAGWRGFPLPKNTDLSAYDLILTSFDRVFEEAAAAGAKSVERFHPGFPENHPVANEPRTPKWDVVFSGSVTFEHKRRIDLLNHLAELSRDPVAPFSFGVFMDDARALSPLVQSLAKPALWAHDMLRLLRAAKIVVNIDVDSFGNQPPNMRLIEATGAGAFLLTPHHPQIGEFFEPGKEIETYRTMNELAAKIHYYLSDDTVREDIALQGQARCMKDHGHAARTAWFADILRTAHKKGPRQLTCTFKSYSFSP